MDLAPETPKKTINLQVDADMFEGIQEIASSGNMSVPGFLKMFMAHVLDTGEYTMTFKRKESPLMSFDGWTNDEIDKFLTKTESLDNVHTQADVDALIAKYTK